VTKESQTAANGRYLCHFKPLIPLSILLLGHSLLQTQYPYSSSHTNQRITVADYLNANGHFQIKYYFPRMFSIVQDMLLLVGAIHLCLLTVNASPGTHIIKIGDNDSHNVEPDTTTASAGDVGSRARPISQS
jgi:hypothetical protein